LGIYEFGSAALCLEKTGRKARTATNMLTEAARENTLDRPSLSPGNPETSGPWDYFHFQIFLLLVLAATFAYNNFPLMKMVGHCGLEPQTSLLSGPRSNQQS